MHLWKYVGNNHFTQNNVKNVPHVITVKEINVLRLSRRGGLGRGNGENSGVLYRPSKGIVRPKGEYNARKKNFHKKAEISGISRDFKL